MLIYFGNYVIWKLLCGVLWVYGKGNYLMFGSSRKLKGSKLKMLNRFSILWTELKFCKSIQHFMSRFNWIYNFYKRFKKLSKIFLTGSENVSKMVQKVFWTSSGFFWTSSDFSELFFFMTRFKNAKIWNFNLLLIFLFNVLFSQWQRKKKTKLTNLDVRGRKHAHQQQK